jgi:putative modified peptide
MEKTAPLDPKIADKLLDLLSTDDDFRDLFQKDPQVALQQVGYSEGTASATSKASSAPSFAACCRVDTLASKEVILAARSEIKKMLTSGLAYTTPQLDATTAAE